MAIFQRIIFLFAILIFPKTVSAVSFTLECEEFHNGPSLLSIVDAGTKAPKVTMKRSGSPVMDLRVTYADKYELIWQDGWGITHSNKSGLCPSENFCPTEKRVSLAVKESGEGRYLNVRQFYTRDCCIEEGYPREAVNYVAGDEMKYGLDSCYLVEIIR